MCDILKDEEDLAFSIHQILILNSGFPGPGQGWESPGPLDLTSGQSPQGSIWATLRRAQMRDELSPNCQKGAFFRPKHFSSPVLVRAFQNLSMFPFRKQRKMRILPENEI